MATDIRAYLEAVAKGKAPVPAKLHSTPVVDPKMLETNGEAFNAWRSLAGRHSNRHRSRGDEPLVAPATTLTPLP